MNYPTMDEINRAHDAITAAGRDAPDTMALSMLVVMHPGLRESTRLKSQLMDIAWSAGGTHADLIKEGTISALTVYGLNLGLRIGEARAEGVRSRSVIQDLLNHQKDCTEAGECRDKIIRVGMGTRQSRRPRRKASGGQIDVVRNKTYQH